ncbi:MAG: RelA/SpoT family protein, partial [Candidatus Kapaibacterium sp.]
DAHRDKVRKSGKPYYFHPVSVALIVINEMPLDDISVASALMHDILNYSDKYSLKDIRTEFGNTIAEVVDGITKIKHIETHNIEHLDQLDNYRRLLLSLFRDVRIILIKIADRLHNLRTAIHLDEEKRHRLANETMEVYAPFANRFGLRNLKWEMEDLAFKTINRDAYDQIRKSIHGTRRDREQYVDKFTAPIRAQLERDQMLNKFELKFDISGRAKHIYSIFNKMKLRRKSIDELYDLFAVRIILDTEDNNMCFYIYGVIAGIYTPVPATFKDYINNPKQNGYQSIHTAVIGPDNRAVEVQIRTRKMHELAEQGVAAHFRYKSGVTSQSVLEDSNLQRWMDMVREIFENVGDETPQLLLESVKKNLFLDEIYVFTPANEFRTLPKDSTPLDFAFDIHSEVGYRCIGAKVNGRIVPLDYKLQSGEQVEILTSRNQRPRRDWLDIVITSRARSLIRKYLRDEKKKLEETGRKIWKEKIADKNIRLSGRDLETLVQSFKFESPEDFYLAIGSGALNFDEAYDFIKFKFNEFMQHDGALTANGSSEQFKTPPKLTVRQLKNGAIAQLAKCCNPLPGDKILAVETPRGMVIHRLGCQSIKTAGQRERIFEIDWSQFEENKIITEIRISGDDRPSLMKDITNAIISIDNISIQGVTFDNFDANFESIITLNLSDPAQIDALFSDLNRLSGVRQVEVINN